MYEQLNYNTRNKHRGLFVYIYLICKFMLLVPPIREQKDIKSLPPSRLLSKILSMTCEGTPAHYF